MKINIRLFEREDAVIEQMKKRGYAVPETVRMILREWGKNEFRDDPLYAKALMERVEIKKQEITRKDGDTQGMTNTEYAEKVLRGKVDGGQVWFKIASGQSLPYSLEGIKKYTTDNEPVIAIHQRLLDRTFTSPSGQSLTDEQYAIIWKDW